MANPGHETTAETNLATASAETDTRVLTDVVTRLRRALRASIRTDYSWESLPMAQVEIMQCLAERDGARIGELATVLRLAQNTVSGLVQQLVENGSLVRRPDPRDRRAVRISISEEGRTRLAGWQAAHERRIGGALATLAPADRAAIRAALPALNHLVERLNK
jgi:DNA-binding MarR family transcriptional regulator